MSRDKTRIWFILAALAVSLAGNGMLLFSDRAHPAVAGAAEAAAAAAETTKVRLDDLGSLDPAQYAQALQEARIPPGLARSLLEARLNWPLTLARAALALNGTRQEFWRFPYPGGQLVEEALQKIRREEIANQVYVAAHFPRDAADGSEAESQRRRAVANVQGDYEDLLESIKNQEAVFRLPTDNRLRRALEENLRTDLENAVGEEGFLQVMKASSPVAARLRDELAIFAPTAEEYDAIFRLRYDFDQKYPIDSILSQTSEGVAERQAGRQKMEEAVAAVLGPERTKQYLRETAPEYVEAVRFTRRIGLSDEVAEQLVSLNRRFANGPLSSADSATQAMVEQQALALLKTAANLRLYQASVGQWMTRMGSPREPAQGIFLYSRP